MSFQAIDINCNEDFIEILIAEMAEIGFSTFQEKDDASGFQAYSEDEVEITPSEVEDVLKKYQDLDTSIQYALSRVEKENWNSDWEKNYDPIIVADQVLVRASFHEPNPKYPYEIVVTPKMSFGTGHHETTHQLVEKLLLTQVESKEILDAGCGTGILGIFAAILGAKHIDAYDIDNWAVENSIENFSLNHIAESTFQVWEGDASSIPAKSYDIILANINRNILMADISYFQKHMKKGSLLLLSGFYESDIEDLLTEARKYSLEEDSRSLRNKWAALSLVKA